MKILVCVKRVIDYNIKVRVRADGSGVDLNNVKMSINPFDEVAIEEAVRQKEAGKASEIIALSIGAKAAKETLRTALAMGADRAILVECEQEIEPLHVAKIVKKIVEEEKPDLVFLGKQAIDDDANQTGQMLAALLNWPQATFISKLELSDKTADATREIDGGTQKLSLRLPAIITTDLRLNEPRYASLPNIVRARKTPIEEKAVADFNIDLQPHLVTLKVEEPAKRPATVSVDNVADLIAKLKEANIL